MLKNNEFCSITTTNGMVYKGHLIRHNTKDNQALIVVSDDLGLSFLSICNVATIRQAITALDKSGKLIDTPESFIATITE